MGYDSHDQTGESAAWDLMYTVTMAVKKIIQNVFEQVVDTGRDMAKSSAKQVKETFSPWDMIRNSFTEEKASPDQNTQSKSKEVLGKGKNNTPLDFDKLQSQYANQDKQKIDVMKQRLFQLVKKDEEKTMMKGKQEKAQKEQSITQEEANARRREEEQRRRLMMSDAPEGKSGRGSALMGKKKKRKPTEPQPAETKPGSGKQ